MSLIALLWLGACTAPTDVVVITIDNLRFDHVGRGAPMASLTPHLDIFAMDAVTYTQAFAPVGACAPSLASLLTGEPPDVHGVFVDRWSGGSALSPGVTTLAERLSPRGYTSAAFVSSLSTNAGSGLTQGYGFVSETPLWRRANGEAGALAAAWVAQASGPLHLWMHSAAALPPLVDYIAVPEAAAWQRDPAGPVLPPQRIRDITDPVFYADRYTHAVRAADKEVGVLLRALRESGRYDGALIVITADHGQSANDRPLWFDAGQGATADQLQVPLLVKLPGSTERGTRRDAPARLEDVVATALDVAGLPTAGVGRSLWRPLAADRTLIGEDAGCIVDPAAPPCPVPGQKTFAARDARFTLLRRPTAEGAAYTLYDRAADPAEQAPLVEAAHPASLRAAVDAAAGRTRSATPATFTAAERSALLSVGLLSSGG